MPAQPILHPSVESLKAFGLGKMDATSAGALIDHLDQCHECSKAVAALSGDDFLKRIRQAHDQNATPTPIKPLSPILRDSKPALSAPKNPPPLPDLPPELAGHPQYEILRELGRGGMGVVYLAKNQLMDRLEVLKVVNKALLDRPSAVERFLREIRSAAKLSHANVVGAYSALQVGDLLAFAMEYVEGEDLAVVVDKHGPLPIVQACYYVQQAALGLQHACEKGMVHRDIKPQNLILARVGKAHVVKVLDFGLAKVVREKAENTGLTGEGKMMGTPDYMAPEQTIDAASADIRADIYSLGCTLYHLLAGEPPFIGGNLYAVLHAHQSLEATPLNQVRPDVPEELAEVVRKMMAKEPDKRYQTPMEVARTLALFVKPDAKKVPPKSVTDPSARGTAVPAERPIPPPLAEGVRKASATQVAPAVAWNSRTEAPNTPAEPRKSQTTRKRRSSTLRKNWLIGGGVAAGLLLALMGLWAGGAFKVKTKTGTIVLENVPDDADVIVDGETLRLRDWEGKEVTIRVAAGKKHQLQVKQEGFKVFGQEVEIDAGKRRAIRVRLQPKAPESVKLSERLPSPPRSDDGIARLIPPAGQRVAIMDERVWKVENDTLVRRSAKWKGDILFGDASWKDYTFSFDVKKLDNEKPFGAIALIRAADLTTQYKFAYGGYANGEWSGLVRIVRGNWTRGHNPRERNALCRKIKPMEKGRWYSFAVTVAGEVITCRIDGIKMFTWKDNSLRSGKVGLGASPGQFAFCKIKVTASDGKVLWEGLPNLN